jgi:hypothetical protein
MSSGDVKKYFETMFFNCYFPKEFFSDGPPPSLSTVSDPLRNRTLKGIAPGVIIKRTTGSDLDTEIWVEDSPSVLIPRREEWGDPNNSVKEIERRLNEALSDGGYTGIRPPVV